MSGYKTIRIYYSDDAGTVKAHTVGMGGVTAIYQNGYSPEPYCGVVLYEVHFENGNKKIYNQKYLPEVELIMRKTPDECVHTK